MKAILNRVRISPKKLSVVAQMVRGKNALEARDILKIMPKKGAQILHKLLSSAIANAEANTKADKKNLEIDHLVVNRSIKLKRHHPVSRGRAQRIEKPTSYISLSLKEVKESKK